MKHFCPSTTNIYENSSPFIYKNISEINTNSNSPIRVRKKRSRIIKVNSLESFKLFKLSDRREKNKLKNKSIKINLNIFITNNLIKYNSYPYYFYIKITNQILFNLPNRLVSVFKDYLIWDGNYDYLKVFYNLKKSVELLPKIGNYYQTYTLFTPIYFPLTDLNDIISKYIKNKMNNLEITQEDNDEIKEEKKDIDKNITEIKYIKKENDDNNNNKNDNNNGGELNNKSKKELPNESDNKNDEKKLINTTEIKTENSGSLSNYFGIDSVIKCKENSNYGVNNNFENQLINYSLLEQIKTKYKDKKDKDKVNLDYSLELAAIIQSFEEKEKDYYNKRKQKRNSCNTKKKKNLSKKNSLVNINNSKTNDYFFKTRSKDNSKTKQNINNSVKTKRKIFNQKLNNKSHSLVSIKSNKENIKTIMENYKQSYHNLKRVTTNNAFYYENHLTINPEKPHLLNNNDNDIIIKDNNMSTVNTNNNNINIINKKKVCCLLHKNSKKPLSPKENNENNLESQTLKYKKIIKKQSKSMIYTIIKNDNNNTQNADDKNTCKNKKIKKNYISLNLNKFNSNKTNEYYCKISTTPTSKLNNIRNNSRNKNDNIYKSQSHRHRTDVKSLNLTPKKIIFVNKKLTTNSINDKKYTEQNTNRISASTNNFNTLNSNKDSNIIVVHKKDFLTKSVKKENRVNTPKYTNASKELDTNRLDCKRHLNRYKSFIGIDYNTFIPKIIMKKMFLNKLKNEKIVINKKLNPKYLSIKKHNISSKKHQNTCSTTNTNNTRTNTNFKNKKKIINTINDKPFVNSKDKNFNKNKNKRALTEINNLIKINQKNERPSHIKNKNISIFSVYEKENSPSYKNKSKNDKFNKALNEINNLKRSYCKSFINKNNLLINVNIYNNFKITSDSNDDQIKLKGRTTINGNLRSSQINKNKIHNLIRKTTNDDINKYQKKPYKLIYGKQSSTNNTYISENITDFSKREKTKLITLK